MVDIQKFVTLSLIANVSSFRDSYSLTKVLAWKFKIIEVREITNDLLEMGLLQCTIADGISQYSITDSGTNYLNDNKIQGTQQLFEIYPGEKDFLSNIMRE